MKNRSSSRTGLFLMELIIAILLFAISGVLCIQMFVKSHLLSKDSVTLNHSILWAQNVAEAFYGCNGDPMEMASLFKDCSYGEWDDGRKFIGIYFDEDFSPYPAGAITQSQIKNDEYCYHLRALITSDNNGLLHCNIQIFQPTEKDNIYELNLSLFPE